MRLIETQSKWGNLYRRAYFVDGRRVTESEFDSVHADMLRDNPCASMAGKVEPTSYGFRTIWES